VDNSARHAEQLSVILCSKFMHFTYQNILMIRNSFNHIHRITVPNLSGDIFI